MGKKRAFIDGTLTTTATSGLFSQDLEDMDRPPQEPPKARPTNGAPPAPDRQPGEDREESEAEVYARAGVEPPARKATPAAEPAPAQGEKAPCPKCGKAAFPSKFPKANQTHFCNLCKLPFAPGVSK
jgi:hypothetical protein